MTVSNIHWEDTIDIDLLVKCQAKENKSLKFYDNLSLGLYITSLAIGILATASFLLAMPMVSFAAISVCIFMFSVTCISFYESMLTRDTLHLIACKIHQLEIIISRRR